MNMPSDLTVANQLARASESINDRGTFDETLDAIVHATHASLPEFGHISISVRNGSGRFETSAGTDQLAWELDSVQYDLGEGPCVQAIEAEPVIVVPYLRHDQRWPRYVPAAALRGCAARWRSGSSPRRGTSRDSTSTPPSATTSTRPPPRRRGSSPRTRRSSWATRRRRTSSTTPC
ncbi:hypothetical protein NOCA1160081 [metagenome]|uniref:GAF domain-containing protein n=1 Tax=metagenome TaxID=256318 RepID=A0A2P2CA38_9ZZZZ